MSDLIPLLADLCFRQESFNIRNGFAESFVKLHDEDWNQAQAHWERIVEKVLNTDAVEPNASGGRAMCQAVEATVALLEGTELHSRCPLCRPVGALESELSK